MNPWLIIAVIVAFGVTNTGSFFFGKRVERNAIMADAATQGDKAAERGEQLGAAVDQYGTAHNAAANLAAANNAGVTSGSIERIRKVYVPGDCRNVDPVILSELQGGATGINEALRSGMRRIAAASGARVPADDASGTGNGVPEAARAVSR